ncbi:MAG: glutamate racemase [Candidatus Pacebacteria bacterium]|nr:glutamate racemase [Candidatus Paceibacterota bacterium]
MESPRNSGSVIGVFDSGFGGLNILKEIVHRLPRYDYLYLGDTARTPYGTRSQEVIYKFTEQAIDFLFQKGCELVILACNTASSEALRKIQQDHLREFYHDKKVLGVIIPAVEEAMERTKNNRLGVMATEGTVSSGAFVREIQKRRKEAMVFQAACPLLVPIVESGEDSPEIVLPVLRKYLAPLLEENIDTLILGCTHYGLLEEQIRSVAGEKVSLIAEGRVVAEKLADYLLRHPEVERKLSLAGGAEFFTTDLTDRFQTLGGKFFGRPISPRKAEL